MQLEIQGVRTVTIVTDAFSTLAVAQARSAGQRGLRLAVISHPIGGLRPTELAGRIAEAARQFGPAQWPAG